MATCKPPLFDNLAAAERQWDAFADCCYLGCQGPDLHSACKAPMSLQPDEIKDENHWDLQARRHSTKWQTWTDEVAVLICFKLSHKHFCKLVFVGGEATV